MEQPFHSSDSDYKITGPWELYSSFYSNVRLFPKWRDQNYNNGLHLHIVLWTYNIESAYLVGLRNTLVHKWSKRVPLKLKPLLLRFLIIMGTIKSALLSRNGIVRLFTELNRIINNGYYNLVFLNDSAQVWRL